MIFIVGVGRSGTSLLQSMLTAHSQINFIPEAQFIKNYMPTKKIQHKIESKGIEVFVEKVKKDERFLKSSIDLDIWIDRLSKQKKINLANAFKEYVDIDTKAKGKRIGGEKDARNIDFLENIKRNFSNSKVILIYRDPRDVVLSKTKAKWSSHRPFWQHALIGNAQLTLGLKTGLKEFGKNFYTVKYEELLNFPDRELEKICDFLNVEYETKMLEFHQQAKRLFLSKREMQYKSNNFKPLLKNNHSKWKKELTPLKIAFIQETNASLMKKLGYEKEKQNAGFLRILLLFAVLVSICFKMIYPLLVKRQLKNSD